MNFSQAFDIPNIPSNRREVFLCGLPRPLLEGTGYIALEVFRYRLAHLHGCVLLMRVLPDKEIPRWVSQCREGYTPYLYLRPLVPGEHIPM